MLYLELNLSFIYSTTILCLQNVQLIFSMFVFVLSHCLIKAHFFQLQFYPAIYPVTAKRNRYIAPSTDNKQFSSVHPEMILLLTTNVFLNYLSVSGLSILFENVFFFHYYQTLRLYQNFILPDVAYTN